MNRVQLLTLVGLSPLGMAFAALMARLVPALKPAAPLFTLLFTFALWLLVQMWQAGALRLGSGRERLVLSKATDSPLRAAAIDSERSLQCPLCRRAVQNRGNCGGCGLTWVKGHAGAVPAPKDAAGPRRGRFQRRAPFFASLSQVLFGASLAALGWWALLATVAAIWHRLSDWRLWLLLAVCLPIMGGVGVLGASGVVEAVRALFVPVWLDLDGRRLRLGFAPSADVPLDDVKGAALYWCGGGGHGIYRVVLLHASGLGFCTPWDGGPKEMRRLAERLAAWLEAGQPV